MNFGDLNKSVKVGNRTYILDRTDSLGSVRILLNREYIEDNSILHNINYKTNKVIFFQV